MAVPNDVTAAREALRALERAVRELSTMFPGSVDAHRLTVDVERVGQDLDLLLGRAASAPQAAAPRLQVIDDTVYPQDFWMDAQDEGLGGGH